MREYYSKRQKRPFTQQITTNVITDDEVKLCATMNFPYEGRKQGFLKVFIKLLLKLSKTVCHGWKVWVAYEKPWFSLSTLLQYSKIQPSMRKNSNKNCSLLERKTICKTKSKSQMQNRLSAWLETHWKWRNHIWD